MNINLHNNGIIPYNFTQNINIINTYNKWTDLLSHIKKGNIKKEGLFLNPPNNFKLPLKMHQQRLLYEMVEKEKMSHRTSNEINMCVIGDMVGSGKSIVILALISLYKNINNNNMINSNKLFLKPMKNQYSLNGFDFNKNKIINSNLIVVPHNVYNQWCEYIINYTELKYLGINNKKDLININLNNLNNYDIILTKSTRYNDFIKMVHEKYNYNSEYISYAKKILDETCNLDFNELNTKWNLLKIHLDNNGDSAGFYNTLCDIKNIFNSIDFNSCNNFMENAGKYLLKNIKYYDGAIFERVIIDEASTINIPNCYPAYGKFNWFITSSVEDIIYPNGKKDLYTQKIITNGIKFTGFIRHTFQNNMNHNMFNNVNYNILKNNDEFIKNSFDLPNPIISKIHCFTPNELQILDGIGLPEVINALNAGDIKSAIEMVGCTVSGEENIIDTVLKKFYNDIDNKNSKINKKITENENINKNIEQLTEDLNSDDSIDIDELIMDINNDNNSDNINNNDTKELITKLKQKIYNNNKFIENTKNNIKNLENRIDSLKSRISNIDNKICPICHSIVDNPAMTDCCKNIFCFECMAMALSYDKAKQCPLCRTEIDITKLIIIDNNIDTNIKDIENKILPTKLDSIMNIINNNKNGKFLIFSEFDHSFTDIIETLHKNNITSALLKGSGNVIQNTINRFDNGDIKVIMLNAQHYGAGLNLQMCTDIILFHRMTRDQETQVIGRGQRMGRTNTLNVHYLCYDNEL